VARNPIDCTLVTCQLVPSLDSDDRLLLRELKKRGLRVSIGVWSDPHVDWSASRLCVLRSTWDYHHRHRDFITWIERVSALTVVRNDQQLLMWNAHKSYLRELEQLGVPIVPTEWLPQGQRRTLDEMRQKRGWHEVVLKPALGAAAHDVTHVRADPAAFAGGEAHLNGLLAKTDVLVQPYLKAVVEYGERALIFLRGRYSHAVVKKPFDTVLIVGGATSIIEATAEEIAVATKAMAALPGAPLYARVDLLRDDANNVRVSEVELIEPGLYLAAHAPAVGALADGVEAEIEKTRRLYA
jgi:glutathione synthase/RimK-type ligase-like ATP-grasp enzyme